MANEFQHKDPGTSLTQGEYITTDGTGHIFDCQATGDILYASSATVLSKLVKQADNTILTLSSCIPAWTASPTLASVAIDNLTINACAITSTAAFTVDATTDIVLDADGDNITFKAGSGDSTGLDFSNSSGTWTVKAGTSDSDFIFNVNDGGVDTKVMAIDGGDAVVTFGGNSVKSGEIRILEDTSCGVYYTAIKVGNMAANVTYTLPTAYAACNGMALTSTTAGVMSWAAAAGCVVCDTSPVLGGSLDASCETILNIANTRQDFTSGSLTVAASGDQDSTFFLEAYSDDGYVPRFAFRSSHNNTLGSHTLVGVAQLGTIDFYGSDGDSFEIGARIQASSTQSWSCSARGTSLLFRTVTDSSTTLTSRMTIENCGNINLMNHDLLNVSNARQDFTDGALTVAGTSTGDIAMEQYIASTQGPALRLRHSRNGTLGSHTAVISGDILGQIRFQGSEGSCFNNGPAIYGIANETFSGTAAGSRLEFSTIDNTTTGTDLRMTIAHNGSIGAPCGTNIYNASDKRLKRNVLNLTNSLDTIKQLQGISFNWIGCFGASEKDKTLYGFIAQDVEAIDANLVSPFGVDGNVMIANGVEIDNPLRVDEKFIIPLLVEAVKELTNDISALKLEARNG